jgi:hypothetical protein
MPVWSQVRTPLPEHSVVPGVHSPEHALLMHAALTQACGADQLPVASHVWTASPEQRLVPGGHEPVQAPATQA